MTSPKRSYITLYEFQNDIFTYSTRIEGLNTIGTLNPVSSGDCPKGRFLYENGRKLYPGANPGINTYMVGVFDPVTFINGFIDPNSKVFSIMNSDKPFLVQIEDATRGIFGTNPNGNTERDQGSGVFTLANSQFGSNVDISGNLVVYGDTTLEDVTVNNLTIHGNTTQIDISDMTSEQFSITNNGTGPALTVNQLGSNDIANFKDDDISVLIIKDGGNVGINTSTPTYKLDVNGSLNALSIYQNSYLLVPPGSLMMYIASSAPSGWLVCDGSAVSRSIYASLFAVIGTTYGVGNNTTTFNLPDMRGRVPVGTGLGSGLTNRILASTGGEETHVLTTTEIPTHTHTGTTSSSGSHTHTHNANNSYPGACLAYRDGTSTRVDADDGQAQELNLDTSAALVINSAGDHTHTFTTGSTGGGDAHNIMQPFLVVNYIIKY